jgi:hypothetical protein
MKRGRGAKSDVAKIAIDPFGRSGQPDRFDSLAFR